MNDPMEMRRIDLLRQLVQSPVWDEVLVPALDDRMKNALYAAMAGRGRLSEAELRGLLGDAANAQWFLSHWMNEIKSFDVMREEEINELREEEKYEARDAFRAEHGMSAVMPEEE